MTEVVVATLESLSERYPHFSEDAVAYVELRERWKQATETRFVPTRAEVPSGYKWLTNVYFEPYSLEIHRDLELQRRGSPQVICREAFMPGSDAPSPNSISLHADAAVPLFVEANREAIWASSNWLAFVVGQGRSEMFPLDRRRWKSPALRRDMPHLKWCQENGLLEPAFLAATIIRHAREVESADFTDQYSAESLGRYEAVTSLTNEAGLPRFRPLSIGQIAGLAIGAMTQDFIEHPELNETYKLTQPFEPLSSGDTVE